jgi:hypothetical protein
VAIIGVMYCLWQEYFARAARMIFSANIDQKCCAIQVSL